MGNKPEQPETKPENEPEKQPEFSGPDVNQVDTSEARVARELDEAAREEGISPGATGPEPGAPAGDAQPDRSGIAQRLAGLLAGGFGMVFAIAVPAWRVTQEEVAALAGTWARVVAKYLPIKYWKYIPDLSGEGEGSECVECDAITVTLKVIGPRVMSENSETDSEADSETKPEPQANGFGISAPQDDAMPDVHGQR